MTAAAPALWTSTELLEWLASLGIGDGLTCPLPIVAGPNIPDMPDVIGLVTPIGGVGESLQGVADTPGFQLLVRGDQEDPASGERLAKWADLLITSAGRSVLPNGLVLQPVQRSGGAPAPVGDEDDAARLLWSTNYLTTVLRRP